MATETVALSQGNGTISAAVVKLGNTSHPLPVIAYGDEPVPEDVTAVTVVSPTSPFPVDASGSDITGNVAVTASVLPSGAATSAKQDSQTTLLTSIDSALAGTLTVDASGSDITGNVTVANILAGNVTSVASLGNILAGNLTSVASITNIANGNLTSAGSVSNILAGNITSVATVTSVTNVANGNLTAVATITNNVKVVGPTAADAALTVAPVTTGGLAKTSLPTAVSDGDVVNALHDVYGRAVVAIGLRENYANQYTTIGNTTETTIITGDASNKLDITALTFTSDAQVSITIRDDTGGTIKDKYTLQGNTSGGFVSSASPKLFQAAVNKPWTAQLSGTANVTVSATYRKSGA